MLTVKEVIDWLERVQGARFVAFFKLRQQGPSDQYQIPLLVWDSVSFDDSMDPTMHVPRCGLYPRRVGLLTTGNLPQQLDQLSISVNPDEILADLHVTNSSISLLLAQPCHCDRCKSRKKGGQYINFFKHLFNDE